MRRHCTIGSIYTPVTKRCLKQMFVLFLLLEKAQITTNAKELLKEGFELVDDALLFLFATTAKAAYGRHQLIYIGAGSFDFSIAEGI